MSTAEPAASRPFMPGYGIVPPDMGGGLLPWSWAVERLQRAHNYWVATTSPEGAPHLAAVWGVWLDGAVHFSTGGRTRKARHLAANPACVVTPERADEAVVLEGVAERVTEPGELSRLLAVYVDKYGSGFPDPDDNPVFAVRPRVVIGLIEREPEFTTRATRWRFAPAAPADPGRRSQ
jgi:Pyridoxamine 5'-phosphate oxidase